MGKKLLSPEAARDFLVRRFNHQHPAWLAGEGGWPLVVALGTPTEKDIAEDPAAVRSWAAAWQSRSGPGELTLEERQFARLGRHLLPASLRFAGPAEVALAVGQARRWATAAERYGQLAQRWPALVQAKVLASKFDVLADYSGEDFERLVALLAWLVAHPESGLYLRQLPVEGLDTKWIEKRTGLVAGLLRALRGIDPAQADFHRVCGLKKPAHRMRVRPLCPELRRAVGGLGDIEAPVEDLAGLPIAPRAAVIVENLETGLALPDRPGTVAIMGLGHAVGAVAALPWLAAIPVVYWGDIDTHGFAILARARQALPQLESVLMDEATLMAHRAFWVQESAPCANAPLEALTVAERIVYEALRADTWGARVRLEQERLDWDRARATLLAALQAQGPVEPGLRSCPVCLGLAPAGDA